MSFHAILIVTALGALTANSPDTPAKSKTELREVKQGLSDLSGYYICKGSELGGKNYSGIAVLAKKNDIYTISWMVGGGSSFSGIAIRNGDTLAASWAIAGDRGVVRGVNVYRIESPTRLVGRWATLPGPGVQQSETLTFLRKLDADGDE